MPSPVASAPFPGSALRPVSPVLSVVGASKTYPGRHRSVAAFASLSFDVGQSEIVVLLGSSGCGKSSLLKAVAGLQPLDAGEIRLRGQRLTGPDPAIGYVFQEPVLLPWLDVASNVAFSLNLRHSPELPRSTQLARVHGALADVGLSDSGAAATHQLSGGMAQRVALARALVREPALLLLDEPFGALDAILRMEMQRLLLKVVGAHRAAVLMVTHDLDEALLLADRILLMAPSPGRIIGEWSVTSPRPRFERSLELAPLRAEILGALSRTLAA
ncbi:MAG: ABC transporter ATP-binding protein [Opitutaceae bacterium]|jgi:NitT/TauT family transport system ATP-binding protein